MMTFFSLALVLLLLCRPAFAQEQQAEPEFASARIGGKTVIFLPSNWTISAVGAEVALTPSKPVQGALASDWWKVVQAEPDRVAFRLADNVDHPSMFAVHANASDVTFQYALTINSTSYSGSIVPEAAGEDSRFVRWVDGKEGAASTFIPEDWQADLQIIRPYESMTGFVFFARADENTLVYVFQPFMPLHLLPSEALCDQAELCPGTVSSEKVREMSLGNAPIAISDLKTPEQYYASEVLPVLRRNLDSYAVESSLPVSALAIDGNYTALMPAQHVEYRFSVEGKEIAGRAMVFTRNHTSAGDSGIWNGFIMGVESLEKNFDEAFQKAAVTLLTLRFDEQWLDDERKALMENANASSPLYEISVLAANRTLDDFGLLVPTAAHKMVRTYNDTMLARFEDSATGDDSFYLPLFPDTQWWYLSGEHLVGREEGRNPMNSTTLVLLFP